MTAETIFQILNRVVANWDSIFIRVYQDGQWRSLKLSEVKDEQAIAEHVIDWLNQRYMKDDEDGLAR